MQLPWLVGLLMAQAVLIVGSSSFIGWALTAAAAEIECVTNGSSWHC